MDTLDLVLPTGASAGFGIGNYSNLAASVVQSLGTSDNTVEEALKQFNGTLSILNSSHDIGVLPELCEGATEFRKVVLRTARDNIGLATDESATKRRSISRWRFRRKQEPSSSKERRSVQKSPSPPSPPGRYAQDVASLMEFSLLLTKKYADLRTKSEVEDNRSNPTQHASHVGTSNLETEVQQGQRQITSLTTSSKVDVADYIQRLSKDSDVNHSISKDILEEFDRHELVEYTVSWLANSLWPLSLNALCVALSMKFRGERSIKHEQPDFLIECRKLVLDSCQTFLCIEPDTGILSFVHESVKEYIKEKQSPKDLDMVTELTAVTLRYLSRTDLVIGVWKTGTDLDAFLQEHPLLEYASHSWVEHARVHRNESTDESALKLLTSGANLTLVLQIQSLSRTKPSIADNEWDELLNLNKRLAMRPLQLAARFGLANAVDSLLSNRRYRDENLDSAEVTPLYEAAKAGHLRIVTALLESGAPVGITDKTGYSPLQHAADNKQSNPEIFRVMLRAEAKQVAGLDYGNLSLPPSSRLLADWPNREEVFNEYIKHMGDSVHANDPESRNALMYLTGVQVLDFAAVEIMLDRKINPEVTSLEVKEMPALHLAICRKSFKMARLLLRCGAKATTLSLHDPQETGLACAVRLGQKDIVNLILSQYSEGLEEVIAEGKLLFPAIKTRDKDIVRLLLDHGASVRCMEDDRQPLSIAVEDRRHTIVELLIASGAIIDHPGGQGTPLFYAIRNQDLAMTKLLLASGSNIMAKNGKQTIVQAAAKTGNLEIAELLMERFSTFDDSAIDLKPIFNLLAGKAVDCKSGTDTEDEVSNPSKPPPSKHLAH
jgi:ankyrin repeat protein